MCRTIPFAPRTGGYQVVGYVYQDTFGLAVLDRWSDEGGVQGVYIDGQDVVLTELSEGFGFEFVEGDSAVIASANPPDAPETACLGTVTQFTAGDDVPTRTYSVVVACASGSATRLGLSENGLVVVSPLGDGVADVQVTRATGGDFFFGSDLLPCHPGLPRSANQ